MDRNDRYVEVYLEQAGVRMCIDLEEVVIDKMNKLREQDPEKWENRDFDLLEETERLLGVQ